MAISDGTAGAWVATTTRNPTVTLPTHSAGDMLLVRMGWKSSTPTTDVAVCNTEGWTKLGQYYNGGGASSNGGGGVLVAVFWKVATSSSETRPVIEFDDATAPSPGAYCAVTYTKGASEAWYDPVGDGGSIAAATSYSGTIQSHVSAVSGDMLDAFAVTNDNTTLTVPTVSQSGLTLDTVTEYPSTALSSASSNDISADGRNRLATAGTSSAAAVVSGTNSVADPGAAWCTRLRVYTPTIIAPSAFDASGSFGTATLAASAQVTPSAIDAPTGGSTYSTDVVADSPIGYYRMNEASGYIQDSSGNANHATSSWGTFAYSDPGLLAGTDDTAIGFDRTLNPVQVIPYTAFQVDDIFTIEAWLQRGDLNTASFYWYFGNRPGSGDGWMLGFNASGQLMFFVYYNGGASSQTIYLSSETFEDTDPHHIVITKNGSTTVAYGDGSTLTKASGTDYTLGSYTNNWGIGNAGDAQGSSQFDGTIDEFAIYDYALTSTQVSDHYTAGTTAGAAPIGSPTVVLGEAPAAGLIRPTGLSSAEAFGTATILRSTATVAPTSIASSEAFSTATVLRGNRTLVATAVASAEAFGSPTLLRGGVTVAPSAIDSVQAFGTATLLRGSVTVVATAIGSAEAFGSTTLRATATIITTGIGTTEAFGTATVVRGNVNIIPTGIVSGEAFGTANLGAIAPPLDILPVAIASTEAFGTAAVLRGAVQVVPTGISSTESFGTATILRGGVFVLSMAISSTEAISSPLVRASAKILPTAIASAQALGTPSVAVGWVAIQPSAIASAEAFGTTFVSTGGSVLQPTGIASAETFGTVTLVAGGRTLVVTAIDTAQSFGTANLTKIARITATGIVSAEQFGVPVVIRGAVSIVPTGATTGEALGTPTIVSGAGVVLPSSVGSTESFGNSTVSIASIPGSTVEPSSVNSGEIFGTATVRPGMVRAIVSGISTEAVVPNPVLYAHNDLAVIGITTAELFGLAVVAKGSAYIRPAGIESGEIVPSAALANLLDSWRWVNNAPALIGTRPGGFPVMQSGLYDTTRQEGEG